MGGDTGDTIAQRALQHSRKGQWLVLVRAGEGDHHGRLRQLPAVEDEPLQLRGVRGVRRARKGPRSTTIKGQGAVGRIEPMLCDGIAAVHAQPELADPQLEAVHGIGLGGGL